MKKGFFNSSIHIACFLILCFSCFICKAQNQDSIVSKDTPFLNFSYITSDEAAHSLYETKTPYVLIYFYNPECEDCAALKKYLSKDKKLNQLIALNQMTIIAIPPQIEKSTWQENIGFVPKNWINGFCPQDRELVLRYLYGRQAPIMFLLDTQRKIILTDISGEFLDKFLDTYFKEHNSKQ